MDELVRVRQLVRHFKVPGGTLKALDGVNFDVRESETLGIVGESGCGKSTLARLVVGIDRPTSGDVVMGGISVAGAVRKERLRLARFCQMVFQDPFASLNPRMRVGDIIREPLTIHDVMDRKKRAREVSRLLGLVGLPRDSVKRFPHEFSGGQRQRIGIARALALKPRVLVADEPVSALDVSVQAQILNLLADLKDELKLTLLLVSHDLSVIEHMSDRVLVMYLGRVVEMGGAELLSQPVHPYTRALLASAPKLFAEDVEELELTGEVPSAISPPTGCAFHPRCGLATPQCSEQAPLPEPRESGSVVACHEV